MVTLTLNNFTFLSSEELSAARKVAIVNAVLTSRSLVKDAIMQSHEAYSLTRLPNFDPAHLPTRFRDHFYTFFRCTTTADFLRTLTQVISALEVLHRGLNSPEFRFREYGTNFVENAIDAVASIFGESIYSSSTKAHVRGFSLNPLKAGNYIAPSEFEKCLNTGKATGNPNEIMIKLSSLDGSQVDLVDTVVHESTHKFLGTEDEGMSTSSLGWMSNNGLEAYRAANGPNIPLPCEMPGFLRMTPEMAIRNAYLLSAYITYFPETSIASMYHIRRAANADPLGQHVRANLPPRPLG